ncbi:MAG: hypothetical protein ACREVI_09710 [Steroidobacteraceae bacterium]
MKIEMTPRIRTLVSGLAAVATTTLLTASVVESLNPAALTQSRRDAANPVIASIDVVRDHAAILS